MTGFRALMIQVWFGEMPAYFKHHLKTVESIPNFDFLIVTDDESLKIDSKNHKIIRSSPADLAQRIEHKTGIKTQVPTTDKLTDFKMCLADLFEEECEGYTHVGFYDIDTLFGSMKEVISAAEDGYDFITIGDDTYLTNRLSGPFVLFRNISEIRRAYFSEKCLEDLQQTERTLCDEKSFSELVFSKYRVKVIDGQNFNSQAGGKTEYDCVWKDGKLSSMGREIMLYHFYHKSKTKIVQLDERTLVSVYDKQLLDDFVWVTGGDELYAGVTEGLLRSIRKYSNRRCLVYCFNFDWTLPADLLASGQFILRRLELPNGEIDWQGKSTEILCLKPRYLLDATHFLPKSKFVYVDSDAALTAAADSVRDYFQELEYYPLINSHSIDDIFVIVDGQHVNSLEILLKKLGSTRVVYPRRKANLMVFDKRSRWFFEAQMDMYDEYKNSEPSIFALHDEDSANALLSKYQFLKALPVIDIEETRSIDLSIYNRYSFGGTVPANVKLPTHPNQILIFHQLKKASDFKEVDDAYGRTVIHKDEMIISYKHGTVTWERNLIEPPAAVPNQIDFVIYDSSYKKIAELCDQSLRQYWFFEIWGLPLAPGNYPTQIVDRETGRILHSDVLHIN